MKLEIRTIQDLHKMKHWLELAASNANDNDFEEINATVKRLDREIAYFDNFNSKEYEAYKKAHEKPLELKGYVFTDKDIKDLADKYIEEQKKREEKAKDLLAKDHSKAVDWMVKTGKFLDDEAVAYGKDEDYGNIRNEIEELQEMFIQYVHCIAEDTDTHELYNDEIDEWYFQRKDTDNKFEKPEYFFPTEVFAFDYKEHYWYYSETNGQGTCFNLCVLDNEGFEKLAKDYGLTAEQLKKKVYKIAG